VEGYTTRFAAADWVAHYARTKPDAVVLQHHDTGETRTWAELDARVGQLAYALRHRLGLSPGDRIVNLSDGDIRHFELLFACARAGLVWVPLNFRLTAVELADLARELSPGLMLTDRIWSAVAAEVVETLGVETMLDWEAGGALDALLDPDLRIEAHDGMDPDAPWMVLFTSGTTGKPKAAIVTQNGVIWQALNQLQYCAVAQPESHVFAPLPLFHAGGLNALSNPILYFGGKVTVSARFDPAAAAAFIGDPANGVTHITLVPLMFQMIADTAEFETADLRHTRGLVAGGARCSQKLIDLYAARGARFTPQYGGTETGPTIASMNPDRLDKILAGSCGQQAIHVQVRLVDDQGGDVAVGTPGEIWVKGPAVIPGYYGKDAVIERPGGWLKTGDVAWQDEEGFFYIVDRVKDMYKSGGENVFPAEVEQVLMLNPAVAEVAVIGVADDKWGEVGLAIAVAAEGHELTLEALRAGCDGKLARYKQPHRLTIVDALPRNVTGKISKPELRARYQGSRSL
jgi:fatty-acyl-CoA synthase